MRSLSFEHSQRRRSSLRERRLISMGDVYLGALQLALTADNRSEGLMLRSSTDARIGNARAKLCCMFNNKHLEKLEDGAVSGHGVCLLVRTFRSHICVALVAATRAFLDGKPLEVRRRVIEKPGTIGQELKVHLKQGETPVLEKLASFYTSRDHANSECALEARKAIARAGRFNAVLAQYVLVWKCVRCRSEVRIQAGRSRLRFNRPNAAANEHASLAASGLAPLTGLDIGVPARGAPGERIRAIYFATSIPCSDFSNYRMPEITRSLLMHRHRSLGEGSEAAAARRRPRRST
jgi:trehalose/maltose hydrolase-like predicted phosphorylase